MMLSLPVEKWELEQVTYQQLIQPVVAFVRDRGPVTAERVQQFISNEAAGDLNFASPTRNRAEAARLVLNLFSEDINVMVLADDIVSVPPDTTTIDSSRFGLRHIPPADTLAAELKASREKRSLREWVSKDLFATKWRNGIREYDSEEIAWMAEQIQQFGYVGPKIVRDAELGTIINGGLRAAALISLGMSVDKYSETMSFENDRHRLAYVLASHAIPGSRTRVPISLRNAILREVLPYRADILRSKGRAILEPSLETWLNLTGNDFNLPPSAPRVALGQPAPPVSEQKDVDGASEVDPLFDEATLTDRILAAMDEEEWVGYDEMYKRLYAAGAGSSRIDDTMREMGKGRNSRLEKRDNPTVAYRKRAIKIAPVAPSAKAKSRVVLSLSPVRHNEHGMHILIDMATENPDQWLMASELDTMVANKLGIPEASSAYYLTNHRRGTSLWTLNGHPWRVEVKKEGRDNWLRAVRE